MDLSALTAISPVDGRYRKQTALLAAYFSEFGLMKYRVLVEVEYLLELAQKNIGNENWELILEHASELRSWYMAFNEQDANKIKEIEAVTNHDVKAVEYFIREKLQEKNWQHFEEWVHFGLTSQDINNTAIPLSIKHAVIEVIRPLFKRLIDKITEMSLEWKDIPMLARTHGQPASPTRLGKEFMVYAERLKEQMELAENIPFAAKFGGATGNFNAHHVAFPQINWEQFGEDFVNQTLGLQRSRVTTQIEHYDHLAALCDNYKRLNNILVDMCRDIWSYISMDYFKQKIREGEVGSSAMPHKVNPIDFENAEGNLGVANTLLEFMAAKLPISRLQRDLTDSTVLRNIGLPFAHIVIALNSVMKGLDKLLLNKKTIHQDLDENWAVVAEAIQTILRRERFPNAYEALKQLTRKNESITKESIAAFIDTLPVNENIKNELRSITPFNYTGIAIYPG